MGFCHSPPTAAVLCTFMSSRLPQFGTHPFHSLCVDWAGRVKKERVNAGAMLYFQVRNSASVLKFVSVQCVNAILTMWAAKSHSTVNLRKMAGWCLEGCIMLWAVGEKAGYVPCKFSGCILSTETMLSENARHLVSFFWCLQCFLMPAANL